jgi:hypothetical protein
LQPIAGFFIVPLKLLKAVVHILLIYLLYLCCYPCAVDSCFDKAEQNDIVYAVGFGDDCSDSEACAPFCFDSCCTPHIICEVEFDEPTTADFTSEEPSFHFSEAFVPEVSTSIWQPPKI